MIRVTIDDVEVSVIEKSVQVKQTIDGRSTCQFTVKDLDLLNHYQDGQPVTLVDSNMGTVFTGYVYDCEETNLYPSTTILSAITCVDAEYLPGKRYYSGLEYKNRFAGDIVTDLLGTVLSAEGITASSASASYQTASEWQLGSLNNVVGTNNVSGG